MSYNITDMFKNISFEQFVANKQPSYQSMLDQKMRDIEKASIAESRAKYGDVPFSCKWEQGSKDDPYTMTFTVTEVGTIQGKEPNQ